ncbi:MAG: hypothetical protein RBJ76_13830 [Stenomitos frigidus ULC029]
MPPTIEATRPLTTPVTIIECPVVLYRGSVLDDTDESKTLPLQFSADTTDEQVKAVVDLILEGTDWQLFSWTRPSNYADDEF